MAGNGDTEGLSERYARYVVSPELVRELAPPLGKVRPSGRRSTRVVVGAAPDRPLPKPRARIIVELDADFAGGVAAARREVLERLARIGVDEARLARAARTFSRNNVFAGLDLDEIGRLVETTDGGRSGIYKVWPDPQLEPYLDRSVRTIKADACFTAFGADGRGVVVAVDVDRCPDGRAADGQSGCCVARA